MSACKVTDCATPAKTRDLCHKHYQRFLKHGDPTITRKPGKAPTRKPGKAPTRHLPPIFEAVWPIIDPGMPRDELVAEALADIHDVASRTRVRLTGTPKFAIRPGRTQRGSQGAAYCLVAHCDAVPADRPYRKAVAA